MTIDNREQRPPEDETSEKASHESGDEMGKRHPYSPPRLEVYGHVSTLTQGGSVGVGESGTPSKKPLGFSSRRPAPRPIGPSRPSDPLRR